MNQTYAPGTVHDKSQRYRQSRSQHIITKQNIISSLLFTRNNYRRTGFGRTSECATYLGDATNRPAHIRTHAAQSGLSAAVALNSYSNALTSTTLFFPPRYACLIHTQRRLILPENRNFRLIRCHTGSSSPRSRRRGDLKHVASAGVQGCPSYCWRVITSCCCCIAAPRVPRGWGYYRCNH